MKQMLNLSFLNQLMLKINLFGSHTTNVSKLD